MKDFNKQVNAKFSKLPMAEGVLEVFEAIELRLPETLEKYGQVDQLTDELKFRILGLAYDHHIYSNVLEEGPGEIGKALSEFSMMKVGAISHTYVSLEKLGLLKIAIEGDRSQESLEKIDLFMQSIKMFNHPLDFYIMLDRYSDYVDRVLSHEFDEQQMTTAMNLILSWFVSVLEDVKSPDKELHEMIDDPEIKPMLKEFLDTLPEDAKTVYMGSIDENGVFEETEVEIPPKSSKLH